MLLAAISETVSGRADRAGEVGHVGRAGEVEAIDLLLDQSRTVIRHGVVVALEHQELADSEFYRVADLVGAGVVATQVRVVHHIDVLLGLQGIGIELDHADVLESVEGAIGERNRIAQIFALASTALWSLKPRPTRRITTADAMSMIASALFSWQVTHAVRESCEIVRYSGSMSCATEAPGPKMRMLASSLTPLGALTPRNPLGTCNVTLPQPRRAAAHVDDTEGALGIDGVVVVGSSLVRDGSQRPFGENVSMSGKAPPARP